MKRIRLLLAVILLLLLCAGGCTGKGGAGSRQLTESQKAADFNCMIAVLQQNYPYFGVYEREHHKDWLSMKSTFLNEVKSTKNDQEFYTALKNTLVSLDNGHVSLLNTPTYEYYKALYKTVPQAQSAAWVKQLNNSKAVARYAKTVGVASSSQASVITSDYAVPNNVSDATLDNGAVAYLRIRSFNGPNEESDMKMIVPFLQKSKNAKALIIDIRGNRGGNSDYWTDRLVPPLLNKPLSYTCFDVFRGGAFDEQFLTSMFGWGYGSLQSAYNLAGLPHTPPEVAKDFKYYHKAIINVEPKNSVGFSGKVYVLIDGKVFSASEGFAAFCKNTGWVSAPAATASVFHPPSAFCPTAG